MKLTGRKAMLVLEKHMPNPEKRLEILEDSLTLLDVPSIAELRQSGEYLWDECEKDATGNNGEQKERTVDGK